jgi:hypothetical protein
VCVQRARPACCCLVTQQEPPHRDKDPERGVSADHGEGSARLLCPGRIHHACNNGTASGMRAPAVVLILQDVSSPSAQTAVLYAPAVQSGRLCNRLTSKQDKAAGGLAQQPFTHQQQPNFDCYSAVCSTLDTTRFAVTSLWRPIPSMQSALHSNSPTCQSQRSHPVERTHGSERRGGLC